MKNTNKKILYALVVAYKNGIINRFPLRKWLDKQQIFKNIFKYSAFSLAFLLVMWLIQNGSIYLPEKTFVGHYAIDTDRLYISALIFPFLISLYKLIHYVMDTIYVHQTMKRYLYCPDDIRVLDRVTFKVKL